MTRTIAIITATIALLAIGLTAWPVGIALMRRG